MAVCEDYARREGLQIVGMYIDRAKSASKSTVTRGQFQKMLDDSGQNLFDFVLVYKLDRFARDRTQSAVSRSILKKNGVRLLSACENLTDSIESILLESMLEGINEYYSAELAQKVRRGRTENFKKGKSLGGKIPLGFKSEGGYWQPDPVTADWVKEIFQRYSEGQPITEICRIAAAKGWHTNAGKPLQKSTVARMLANRKYIGMLSYQGEEKQCLPVLIDPVIFENVQKLLGRKKHMPNKSLESYLLTGKLFCGVCGEGFVGKSGTSKTGKIYRYYNCLNHTKGECEMKPQRADDIENAVYAACISALDDAVLQEIAATVVAILEEQAKATDKLPELRIALSDRKKQKDNLIDQIAKGAPYGLFAERLNALESEITDLSIRISSEELLKHRKKFDAETVLTWMRGFLAKDTPETRKRVFNMLLNRVYLYPDGRMTLALNLTGDSAEKSISLSECSSLDASASPFATKANTKMYFFDSLLIIDLA